MEDAVEYFENQLRFRTTAADIVDAFNDGAKIAVIDARSPEEYEREHIPGAVNVPVRMISDEIIEKFDQNYLYVTYGSGIGTSDATIAALQLARYGIVVKELLGGLHWWKKQGFQTDGTRGTRNPA